MYLIRNNNSILFQQINTEYWCIKVPLDLFNEILFNSNMAPEEKHGQKYFFSTFKAWTGDKKLFQGQ